ncbi:MAG: hypothetical protein SWH54_04675 [Thermodesulfobacteriota bacterium]|nr:hypothetical protein [Thermodesulfobacteriota bacterium]
MKSTQLKKIITFILFVLLYGCSHSYSVKPFPVKPDLVPEMNVKDSVHIINAQHQGKNTVFYSIAGSKWIGDLGEWTEKAAGLLKFELKKRNINVTEDAHKILKLTITAGKLNSEFSGIRCIVMLKVEVADGYTQEYEGNHINHSPFAQQARYHAGAGAITKAVTALLNDKKIISYLEK